MARALRRGGAAHDRRADPDARRHDRRRGASGSDDARPSSSSAPRRATASSASRSPSAAEGLRRLGVSAGDRVALVLPNCPQHVVAFYAVLRLGAIVVEHNPLYTPPELRHQFEDHGARVAIVWNSVADTVAEFPSDIRPAHIVAVDLTKALPFGKRMALRLPIPKARRSRAALTTTPRARGLVAMGAPHLAAGAGHAASATLARRHGRAAVHERHHRQAEGRRAQPPQPACQCDAGARVGAGPRRGRGGLLRGAAALPRLRHDALPDLRDEHRRPPRALPEVRLEARARCGAPLAADVPARRSPDLRPARARGRGAHSRCSRASASPSRAR